MILIPNDYVRFHLCCVSRRLSVSCGVDSSKTTFIKVDKISLKSGLFLGSSAQHLFFYLFLFIYLFFVYYLFIFCLFFIFNKKKFFFFELPLYDIAENIRAIFGYGKSSSFSCNKPNNLNGFPWGKWHLFCDKLPLFDYLMIVLKYGM